MALLSYIIITTILSYLLHCCYFVWCSCMAINVHDVQYTGGLLPDILLLTQVPIFVWFDGTIIHIITILF